MPGDDQQINPNTSRVAPIVMAMIAMIDKGPEGVEVALLDCCEKKRGWLVNSPESADEEEEG